MTAKQRTVRTGELLELVADPGRRRVLQHLRAHGDRSVTVDELADVLRRDGPRETMETARLTLEHAHLPQLAEVGLIAYDDRSGTVRYYSRDDVEKLLDFVTTELA